MHPRPRPSPSLPLALLPASLRADPPLSLPRLPFEEGQRAMEVGAKGGAWNTGSRGLPPLSVWLGLASARACTFVYVSLLRVRSSVISGGSCARCLFFLSLPLSLYAS